MLDTYRLHTLPQQTSRHSSTRPFPENPSPFTLPPPIPSSLARNQADHLSPYPFYRLSGKTPAKSTTSYARRAPNFRTPSPSARTARTQREIPITSAGSISCRPTSTGVSTTLSCVFGMRRGEARQDAEKEVRKEMHARLYG
jgi:hypothetical protein